MTKAGEKILASANEALELVRKENKRVLVCGGRDYKDQDCVFRTLDAVPGGISVVIEGEAPGADNLAKAWALSRGVPVEAYPAHWDDLETQPVVIRFRKDGSRYNAAAGGIRNKRMLDEGRPDMVVAFPGGQGTKDMMRQASQAGVPIMQVFK